MKGSNRMTSEKCKLQISLSSALERGRAVKIVLEENQDSIEPDFVILTPSALPSSTLPMIGSMRSDDSAGPHWREPSQL